MPDDPLHIGEAIEPSLAERARAHADRASDVDELEDAFPAEAASTVEAMRERRWNAKVPQRLRTARVTDFSPEIAEALTEWIVDPLGRNLLLLGAVGVGKSRAAVAAMRHAHDAGLDIAFWPMVELLEALRPGGDEHVLDDVCDIDRLALDDVGAERLSEWGAERLYLIVNHRWLDELPTIVTTNLEPEALAEIIGARLYSRVIGNDSVIVWLAGPDRRRNG